MLAITLALLSAAGAQDTARFQQGVEYRIEARLDEDTDVLRGRARLRYTNHSPATLDTLWFHQHLNAFRPNSAWARRELELDERRFQSLGPEEHAYERFTEVLVGDVAVRPVYPGAPDSTVAGVPLPAPLRPGESVTLHLGWDARLSTLPRRQGRAGRHYDFAQWYPRIAVYDRGGWQVQPLMPQGEFYGEFGAFDVTLDVADDQVLGFTGVAVEGDPGWKRAAAPGTGEVRYQRDFYTPAPAASLGLLPGEPAAGRKRVRLRAEKVHHFAWSADPAYIYEAGETRRTGGGDTEPIAIHVLYRPGDDEWDDGVVVRRTAEVLDWLQTLMGPYPWPQLTNLHRLEGGGTEFPMLVMDGSASEGLIAHEVTHQYLHGILANNEWKEGFMDEGFTSFVDTWYFEDQGRTGLWDRSLEGVRGLEKAGRTQTVATPGADFTDPRTYSAMTYTKASLVFRMLRGLVGDETMRAIMREFYREHALQHVTAADFERVASRVAERDLGWFFDQWFRSTAQLDYRLGEVRTERTAGGRWRTTVEVIREGDAWMPVTLRVGDAERTLTSADRRQTVEVVTASRPREVALDPDALLLDVDVGNNRKRP